MGNLRQPALLGGVPAFDKPYHLARPDLPPIEDLIEGIESLYDSRMLSNQGRFVRELEEKVAQKTNAKYCAVFCNGTIAIMCLLKALDIHGEIILPSFTFTATVQALSWVGLEPRFVDVRKDNLTLAPESIKEALDDNVSAIFPVNIFGSYCNHEEIQTLAEERKLPLVYDSAQAFGTKYKGKPAGSFGLAEVFSFHATKIFHTMEGGAVTTNDLDLYKTLCKIRNFGFEEYLDCAGPGINGKMNEISALMGLKLIDSLNERIASRKTSINLYKQSLEGISGISFKAEVEHVENNNSYCCVIVDPQFFGISSLELNYALAAENIVTRCYFYPPVHKTKHYRAKYGNPPFPLPNTDWAASHVLCLPINSEMKEDDILRITDAIANCRKNLKAIKVALDGLVPENVDSLGAASFTDPHDRFIASIENGVTLV